MTAKGSILHPHDLPRCEAGRCQTNMRQVAANGCMRLARTCFSVTVAGLFAGACVGGLPSVQNPGVNEIGPPSVMTPDQSAMRGRFLYDTIAWTRRRAANGEVHFHCTPDYCGEPVIVETYVDDLKPQDGTVLQNDAMGLEVMRGFGANFASEYRSKGFRINSVSGPRLTRHIRSPAYYWRFDLTSRNSGQRFQDSVSIVILPNKLLGVSGRSTQFAVSDKYMKQFINAYRPRAYSAGSHGSTGSISPSGL